MGVANSPDPLTSSRLRALVVLCSMTAAGEIATLRALRDHVIYRLTALRGQLDRGRARGAWRGRPAVPSPLSGLARRVPWALPPRMHPPAICHQASCSHQASAIGHQTSAIASVVSHRPSNITHQTQASQPSRSLNKSQKSAIVPPKGCFMSLGKKLNDNYFWLDDGLRRNRKLFLTK